MITLSMAKDDATEQEIIEAAKIANVHDFIMSLPDGYQTFINEEGTNVSQGEKQLITIARAVLADPSILILDEATSSIRYSFREKTAKSYAKYYGWTYQLCNCTPLINHTKCRLNFGYERWSYCRKRYA